MFCGVWFRSWHRPHKLYHKFTRFFSVNLWRIHLFASVVLVAFVFRQLKTTVDTLVKRINHQTNRQTCAYNMFDMFFQMLVCSFAGAFKCLAYNMSHIRAAWHIMGDIERWMRGMLKRNNTHTKNKSTPMLDKQT